MKKRLSAVFIMVIALAATAWAETPALMGVKYLGVDPPIEDSTDNKGERLYAYSFNSSVKLGIADENAPAAEVFLLRAKQPLSLQFLAVEELSAAGEPLPGPLLGSYELGKDEFFLFTHPVPEGMPNLMVCAQAGDEKRYWIPRFSGMDGSVEFDPGFVSSQ